MGNVEGTVGARVRKLLLSLLNPLLPWPNSLNPRRNHLRKKRVEAVDFLPFFDESVVLRDALKSQVVHEVDLVRVRDELVLERLDGHWECGRKQAHLAVRSRQVNQLFQKWLELRREQLVGLLTRKCCYNYLVAR